MFKTMSPKGEETRGRIYQAALELFRTKGFETATMREVAEAAGMSLGAAYHYFPSKDAIVLAYYEEVTAEHERRVAAALRNVPPRALRERLRVPFHEKLDILAQDRPLMGALLRFAGQPSHPLSFLGESTRHIQYRAMAIFAESLRGADLPDDTRQLAPVALWAMHMGLLLYFLYDESPEQRRTRTLVDGGVDLFLAALKLSKLPMLRGFRRKILTLLGDARLLPPAGEVARLMEASA